MGSCPWNGFEPATISFCEQRLCSWVVEPANTWSNIGFVLVGLLILLREFRCQRPDLMMIGITAVAVGINSSLFHASGTRWGEIVDVSAMYFISSLFIVLSIKRIWHLSSVTMISWYVTLAASTSAAMVLFGSNGIILFGLHITAAVLLEGYFYRSSTNRVKFVNLAFMALCFGISFTAWKLDISKVICDPNNHVFGGHALWHLGNALCLWFYYRYQTQFKKGLT